MPFAGSNARVAAQSEIEPPPGLPSMSGWSRAMLGSEQRIPLRSPGGRRGQAPASLCARPSSSTIRARGHRVNMSIETVSIGERRCTRRSTPAPAQKAPGVPRRVSRQPAVRHHLLTCLLFEGRLFGRRETYSVVDLKGCEPRGGNDRARPRGSWHGGRELQSGPNITRPRRISSRQVAAECLRCTEGQSKSAFRLRSWNSSKINAA